MRTRPALHSLWKYVRGPFFIVQCNATSEHQWERYDCDKAGCLRCGSEHICCKNIFTNQDNCPLHENDDKSFTCTITGLTITSIRTSDSEYFENYTFTPAQPAQVAASSANVTLKNDEIRDFVMLILQEFLFNNKMRACKVRENQKRLQKIHTNTVRWLKAYKVSHPNQVPNLHSVIAQSLVLTKLNYTSSPTLELISFCAQHITKCVIDLDLVQSVTNKNHLVIGLLYLMKSGLCINNAYWLPKCTQLQFCLPQENSLEKIFGISIKTICETENHIKLILRNRNKSL